MKHGLKVIEDAAHALPTTYRDKLGGAFESDATVYSFYVNYVIGMSFVSDLVYHKG